MDLKHRVEEALGSYIPNGVFIQACKELHYEFKQSHVGSLNADIKVGVRKDRKYNLALDRQAIWEYNKDEQK